MAIATAPWSISNSRPSGIETSMGSEARPSAPAAAETVGRGRSCSSCSAVAEWLGASEAGKDSFSCSETSSWT